MPILIRDMDNDGDMDIVTSDRKAGKTNGVRWLENPGEFEKQTQEWTNHFMGGEGLEVMFIDMADIDGDGLEDAIVTEYTNQKIVFIKRLDSTVLKWKSYSIAIPKITGRAKAVKVGDIDRDGNLDLVHTANTLGGNKKSGIFWLSYRDKPSNPIWDWYDINGPEGTKFDRVELLDLAGW